MTRLIRFLAIILAMLVAGCSDKSPDTTSESNTQQLRQKKLDDLMAKAVAGDVVAMLEVGKAFEEGKNWGRDERTYDRAEDPLIDLDQAGDWYEKAATQGNAEAQYRLALLFDARGFSDLKPKKREKNQRTALNWFEKAAEQNHRGALHRLGELYAEGDGAQSDPWKSFSYFKKAAELGHADSQARLGNLLYTGAPADPSTCANAPASAENPIALGKIHEQIQWTSCTSDKNPSAAATWWEKAASQGHAYAKYNLAIVYRTGDGVPKDTARAFKFFEAVARLGDPETLKFVELFLTPDYVFEAQTFVGDMYSNGEGTPKDDAKAVMWYQKAASSGNAHAQQNLGVAYISGDGVAIDLVLGYAWSNLASGQGNVDAGKNRNIAATRMSPNEIAEAQRLASNWKQFQTIARENSTGDGSKQASAQGTLAKTGSGTAFVLNKAGLSITNHHVINGCSEVRAEGREGVVKVVTSDVVNDLALLQIPGTVTVSATVASEPAKLRQGEDIVVFGFPLNSVLSSGGNMTPGVVSALTGLGNNTNQIQITAPIQPGSSGSPVLNMKGEIVGVVSMKLSDSKMAKATGSIGQNINFAVSGQTLKTFLDTHKVEHRSGSGFSFGSKSTADLADEARKWTLVVECWK
jgi:uncharacterized protein